MIEGYQNKLYQ